MHCAVFTLGSGKNKTTIDDAGALTVQTPETKLIFA